MGFAEDIEINVTEKLSLKLFFFVKKEKWDLLKMHK